MPHISLPAEIPGIGAAFAFRPKTANPMRELAHILLFEPGSDASLNSTLMTVSSSRATSLHATTATSCQTSHGAAAAAHPGGSPELVAAVCDDPDTAAISDKLKALLKIAACVQADAKTVTPVMIQGARDHGATDLEIHDTVLIAAAFSMYNRYVDGLSTWQPRNDEMYRTMGQQLAQQGYAR